MHSLDQLVPFAKKIGKWQIGLGVGWTLARAVQESGRSNSLNQRPNRPDFVVFARTCAMDAAKTRLGCHVGTADSALKQRLEKPTARFEKQFYQPSTPDLHRSRSHQNTCGGIVTT
jgi:hypothetical protein